MGPDLREVVLVVAEEEDSLEMILISNREDQEVDSINHTTLLEVAVREAEELTMIVMRNSRTKDLKEAEAHLEMTIEKIESTELPEENSEVEEVAIEVPDQTLSMKILTDLITEVA
jgi:hypothetical protein